MELLLSTNICSSLLPPSPEDTADNDRTTFLHLAARNGHSDVIRSVYSLSRILPLFSGNTPQGVDFGNQSCGGYNYNFRVKEPSRHLLDLVENDSLQCTRVLSVHKTSLAT